MTQRNIWCFERAGQLNHFQSKPRHFHVLEIAPIIHGEREKMQQLPVIVVPFSCAVVD